MQLGLFESPFVDETKAATVVGRKTSKALALQIQSRSPVMLLNRDNLLPLAVSAAAKIHVIGQVNGSAFEQAGWTLVDDPNQADVVLAKLNAPYETLYPNYFFGAIQHDGSLAFSANDPQLEALRRLPTNIPVITSVYIDRPAVLAPLLPMSTSVIANFGLSDEALVAIITGREKAVGRLPFELPSSMQAVLNQRSDQPSDSASPLFEVGFTLPY